jgi:DNA-binding IclR family transcriptional regulator
VYVDIVESDRRALSIKNRAGDRVPLHCSGTGTCLLAFLDKEEATRLLASTELSPLTAKTITDPEVLLRELAAIRARGYSVDRGESEDGLASIAAPVRDADGAFFGAVCIAGPAERVLGGNHTGLVALVRAAADEISVLIEAIGRSSWPPYTRPADAVRRRR